MLGCAVLPAGAWEWSVSFDLKCISTEAILSQTFVRTQCDTWESPWELICGRLPHQQTIHRLEPLMLLCRHLASPTRLSSSCRFRDFSISLACTCTSKAARKPRLTFQTRTQLGLGLGQLLHDLMVLARHCGAQRLLPALCK